MRPPRSCGPAAEPEALDPPELVAAAVNLPLKSKSLNDPQIRSALSFELARHITCEPAEANRR